MLNERAISLVTYNRATQIGEVLESIFKTKPNDARVFVCDDGSTDNTSEIVTQFKDVTYVKGKNLGVGANKNRALFLMRDAAFMCIIEDDLVPIQNNWFTEYENAALCTGIHHWSRVQDKLIEESIPEFTVWMKSKGITPIYGPSVRGDFTFITKKVIRQVGGFNPQFIGVGGAHGEWSNRVFKAGLIPHPLRWIDLLETSQKFKQLGDTEGGRWLRPKGEVKNEIKRNVALAKKLRQQNYIYHNLVFP